MANASNRELTEKVRNALYPPKSGYVVTDKRTGFDLTDWVSLSLNEVEERVRERNGDDDRYSYRWSVNIPNPDADPSTVDTVCDAVLDWVESAVMDYDQGCDEGKRAFLE